MRDIEYLYVFNGVELHRYYYSTKFYCERYNGDGEWVIRYSISSDALNDNYEFFSGQPGCVITYDLDEAMEIYEWGSIR